MRKRKNKNWIKSNKVLTTLIIVVVMQFFLIIDLYYQQTQLYQAYRQNWETIKELASNFDKGFSWVNDAISQIETYLNSN